MEQFPIETNNINKPFSLGYESLEETCFSIEHLRGEYDYAIVILCGGISKAYGDTWKSNWISRMRMFAGAIEYYNAIEEGKKPVVIVSGGTETLRARNLTVSTVMTNELMELEVPYENIILEQFSFDTSQNAQNSSKILNTLGFDQEGSVKLITNGFHLKRSEKLFRKNFNGNLEANGAEEIMIDFGESKLPGQKLNRRYGEFAKRFSRSCKNKKRIIQDSAIRGISDLPGGQDFLTWLAASSR